MTYTWKHPALRASQAWDPKEINQNHSLQATNHWDSGKCSSQTPGGRSDRGCRALGWVCGRGTNPALFPPLQPPGRDEVTGPGIKPGFLGPGQRGRAGLGAQMGTQAEQPPKPTLIFINGWHPPGPSAVTAASPAVSSSEYFGKEEVKRGARLSARRRKEIRGSTAGRKSAVRTWPWFHHVPAAFRKRRHAAAGHLAHLPPGRAHDTCRSIFGSGEEKSRLGHSPQGQSSGT